MEIEISMHGQIPGFVLYSSSVQKQHEGSTSVFLLRAYVSFMHRFHSLFSLQCDINRIASLCGIITIELFL